ncbi:MAG: hypothetical protein ACYDDF_11710 [Thermoplasmatota archaeon]
MARWEYAIETPAEGAALQPLLDARGSDGWELACALPFGSFGTALVFKRPVAKRHVPLAGIESVPWAADLATAARIPAFRKEAH